MPDCTWAKAKLYAPHVAAVLDQLQASGAEPTEAATWLLARSSIYAEYVLCDYQQVLRYALRVVEAC